MTTVARSLFRVHRPIVAWFWSLIALAAVVVNVTLARFTDSGRSIWLLITGQAVQWWLLVVGVLLVALHLRLYVAQGITRRGFLLGAGLFGGVTAVLFAVLVPVGHGVERLVWAAFGGPPADYPVFSAAEAVREFGYVLPGALGGLVSGALIAAGFYRFSWWAGLLLTLPGALPVLVAGGLFGLYDPAAGPSPRWLPFAAALAVSLLVTAVGAVLLHLQMRDATIRRAAG